MSWGISRSKIKRLYMYFMSCWFWWLMVLIFRRFLLASPERLKALRVAWVSSRKRGVAAWLTASWNPWKMDGWKTILSYWGGLFSGDYVKNFGVYWIRTDLCNTSRSNIGTEGTEETADQPKLWVANFFRVDKSFEWHVWLQAMMKSSWTFKSCLQILWVLIDEAWLVFWKNHQSNFKKERHSSHFIPKMWFMVNMPWCPACWSSPSPVWDYQLTSDSVKRMPVLKRTQISQLGWEICIDISRYLR